MSTLTHCPRVARASPLAACLAAALGLTSFHAISGPNRALMTPKHAPRAAAGGSAEIDPLLPGYLRLAAARAEAEKPTHPTADHLVTSCFDNGVPGTLRYEITHAASGDSINLTQLACSKITLGGLAGTEINIPQDELHIHGPGADQLTIDGYFQSRVFNHTGSGLLGFTGVTIANGYYIAGGNPRGGCIYSMGDVLLIGSVVSDCTVQTTNQLPAQGGGIFTHGTTALFQSAVTGSHAYTQTGAYARGGGIYAKGDFSSQISTVSDNVAGPVLSGGGFAIGGGIYTKGNVYIEGSTISGNAATGAGGVSIVSASPGSATAEFANTTVSDNRATFTLGGIYSNVALTLANSTVAFNTSGYLNRAGVFLSNADLNATSSIIASNAGPGGSSDLDGTPNVSVTGSDNLITSSTLSVPFGTRFDCPHLDPLANNGGTTLTHKLRHDSAAIDHGDPGTLLFDQRGADRVYGAAADIGAVEWQPTDVDERLLANGFDGVCDR